MSLRDEWCRLVEEVAGINSTDPLPREYTPVEYLPGGREIPEAVLQHIRAAAAEFDVESRALFHPQMTPEEGYRAAPVVSWQDAFASSLVNPEGSGSNNNDELENNKGKNRSGSGNDKKPLALTSGGPNFFEAYRRHATAAAVTDAKGNRDSLSSAVANAAAGSHVARSLGSASRLASGFLLPEYYSQKHRQPDFIPVILVPASVSSLLQLFNIREFLERGIYIDPPTQFVDAETGAVNVQENKPDTVIVTPGSFLDADKYTVAYKMFRVVDDPKQVKNWQHVCACIVDGHEWQFRGWFPNEAVPIPVS
ncbi:parafibromin [Trypanosoma rangeli SC58]|uniref:Parafibromin n=1 Tax=Trypanosoma rangeli SC58 TaxID=429131 RepID=A0A061IUA8_TRYRA|nr:parafibromin [Trypanosoma rangeli SC58]ESL08200.1 parafibromin [Trypanosoma rangeli SC58]